MDKRLLQQLYETYHKELYLYLCSLCHDAGLAEDLVQETFMKALLSLSDEHTNMRAWLYMVARNLYFNYVKRERRKISLETLEQEADTKNRTQLEVMIEDEKKQLLYEAMNHLSREKREVLLLQYFGGLSQKEIAAILRLTPENVRVLGYRGKKELRAYMEVQGYDIS